jgi:hypothetical protein
VIENTQQKETKMIISSQKYIDPEIVQSKIDSSDYAVSVGRIGEYTVVIDGHQSLAAAKIANVSPIYVACDSQIQQELDYLVETIGQDEALIAKYIDSDYYDVETGRNIF